MNQSITNIFRFFISHDFYMGVNVALGIFIPVAVLFALNFDYNILLITGYGSLSIAIADQTGPFKHKRNELFGTLIATLIISFAYTHLTQFNVTMIVAISFIVFIGSYITALGKKSGAIGFVLVFSALMAVRTHYDPVLYLIFFSFGAIAYFIYTLAITKIFEQYIIRQNLSTVYFLLSEYLKAVSGCYRQNNDIKEQFYQLIESQTALLDQLQLMRDLIFRYNKKKHKICLMINELILLIDIKDTSTSSLQDFTTIRQYFPNTDIQIFFRDAYIKAGTNLEEMGLFSLKVGSVLKRLGFKAELRALEYELELVKKESKEKDIIEGYQILISHYRKIWSLSRQLERLRTLLIGEIQPDEKVFKESFSRFLSKEYWSLSILKNNFNLKSDYMRYAIRTALAMFFALILVKFIIVNNLSSHSFWIAFTLISLMKPGFSITKERSRNRIIGTILGCLIGGFLIAIKTSISGMVALLFISVILSHGLGGINYRLSVTATTVYVLILLNIQQLNSLQGLTLATERIIDTIIAAVIAIGFSTYIFPFWERDNIPAMLKKINDKLYNVVNEIENVWINGTASNDLGLKLTLRESQASIVQLSNSIHRMHNEPKYAHLDLHILNDQLIRFQSILSQLSYMSFLFIHLDKKLNEIDEFNELFHITKMRMNPENIVNNEDVKPFSSKELKPLIWILESHQTV